MKLISLLSVTLLLTSCSFGEKPDKSLASFSKVCAKWDGLDITKLEYDTIEQLIVESNPFLNEGIAFGDGSSSLGKSFQKTFDNLQQNIIDQKKLLDDVLEYKNQGNSDWRKEFLFEQLQEGIEAKYEIIKIELENYCDFKSKSN